MGDVNVRDENKTAVLSAKCAVEARVIIFKLPSDIPFDLSLVRRYELSIQHPLINHARLVAQATSFSYFCNLLYGVLCGKERDEAVTDLFLT